MKRLNCTVGDRRGYKGDCMEISSSGRYVEFDAAMRAKTHAARQISALEQQRDELLVAINEAIEYLEPRVSGGKIGVALVPKLKAVVAAYGKNN